MVHLDRSAVVDPAELAHITDVVGVLRGAVEEACAARIEPCLGPAGWAVGPNRAADHKLLSTWAGGIYALVAWDPDGASGAHMAVGAGRCESPAGWMAGFRAKRAHYEACLVTRFREYLGTVDHSRVSLVRVWRAPAGIAFQSVADALLSDAEDAAITRCHQLKKAQDGRFAIILNKNRASRCRFPCGPGPFHSARAETFMVSMRLYYAREGHCHPVEIVEGLPYPGDFGFDAWLNRRYGHLVHPASPLEVPNASALCPLTQQGAIPTSFPSSPGGT
ncbi:hypothetical protein I4F81_007431 [Pyropia yezoensis]|uniref:Uncharacterized protein n=1 Tax=Pyropia yezoensis TaxID=2788 RepID=A0ACC3C442_PYRYE|nr:hypothetical protein I4F81_007431 [Neopyropia yezoensis]